MAQTQNKTAHSVVAYNTVAAILAAGNTELLEVLVDGIEQVWVEVVLTTQAFDAFIIEGKMTPESGYLTLTNAVVGSASAAPQPVGLILAASAHTFASLAAAATGWLLLNTHGLYSIRISASAAVNGANVTIRASGRSSR